MKILIDLTSLADNFSGIERFAMSIAKELIQDSSNSYILLFKNRVHEAFEQDYDNVEKVVLKGGNKLMFAQLTLPLALLKYRADRYLFLAFPAPFLFLSKKAVSAIHDLGCWDCPGANKRYMSLYFQILYMKAALFDRNIVTVSDFSKMRIQSILKVKPERIWVIHNGLSEELLEFQYSQQQDEAAIEKYNLPHEYLLCLSTLEPRKNLKLLIQAYENLLLKGRIATPLVLAGRKGWLIDDLLSNLQENTVKNIHFTGFVDESDLPYVYRNAKLFVFPSFYEGFGVPPIEAMAMETIVVSSNAASLPEILKDEAIYFENNDVESLEEAIYNGLSLQKNVQLAMLSRGKQTAMYYQWETAANKLGDLLKEKTSE